MPMYEYICTACSKKFEELVFGDTKVKCPECGSESVNKLISTFSSSIPGSTSSGGASSGGHGFG